MDVPAAQWPFYPHPLRTGGARGRTLSHPVCIIGAGIGGLSLALSLQRAALPYLLFERDTPEAARWGYGMTLQATTTLRDLGIFEAVSAKTEESVSSEHWLFSEGGSILGYFGRTLCQQASSGEEGAASERGNIRIPRADLLRLMREALPPGTVRHGHSLASYHELPSGLLELQFEGGSHPAVLASVLVGADGLRSRVRALALQRSLAPAPGPPPAASSAPLTLSHMGVVLILGLSTCQHPLLASRGFYTLTGSHRLFTMPYAPATPTTPPLTMWQLSYASPAHCGTGEAVEAAGRHVRTLPSEALLALALAATAGWHAPCPALLAASQPGSVWATSLVDLGGSVATLGLPSVTLVGDAAHPMSPFKGQGANQALMDGPLLAACLCKAGVPAALKAYEREMGVRAGRKVAASRSAALHLHSAAVLAEAGVVSGVQGEGRVRQVLEVARRRGVGAAAGERINSLFQECVREASGSAVAEAAAAAAAEGAQAEAATVAAAAATAASSPPVPTAKWTLLYYCYVRLGVDGRQGVLDWLASPAGPAANGCVGRIRVGLDGVNACLGAPDLPTLQAHAAALSSACHPLLTAAAAARPIDYKYAPSAGARSAEATAGCCFDGPVRSVSCSEIVTLGLRGEDPAPAEAGGVHLPPEQFHSMLLQGGREAAAAGAGSGGAGSAASSSAPTVVIDVRNQYEHAVGRFAPPPGVTLLLPPVKVFAEMPAWLQSKEARAALQGAGRVMAYCTGGVRCERFTSLLKATLPGKDVYQLEGGIQRYMEAGEAGRLGGAGSSGAASSSSSASLWAGRLFVFDERPPVRLAGSLEGDRGSGSGAGGAVVGACLLCAAAWDQYLGWLRCERCGMLVLVCSACQGGGEEGQGREQLLARLVCTGCQWKQAEGLAGGKRAGQAQPPRVKSGRMREGRKREREQEGADKATAEGMDLEACQGAHTLWGEEEDF